MKQTIRKQLSTYASVFGLGALLVFTGCVKQHDKRALDADKAVEARRFAIVEGTRSDGQGVEVKTLSGAYQVETDYLGCEVVPESTQVGPLKDSDKTVVELSSGKKAACLSPGALNAIVERPHVTIKGGKVPATEFWVQTRRVIRRSGRTKALDGVDSGAGTGIKLLDVVEYNTNSPILKAIADRVDLRAVPGETYKLYHKITSSHMYLMLVTPKDMMSHVDFPISDNLGNGEYAVPIAWSGIALLKQQLKLNADNEKTNIIEYLPVENIDQATHVDIDVKDFEEFGFKDVFGLEDVYPTNYFTDGQWYFSESVVDTRPGSEGFIGTTTGAFDTSFRSATRIQFTRRDSGLVACNVSIDQRYANDYECKESDTVLTIPGDGIAYGLETSGNTAVLSRYGVLAQYAPFYRLKLDDMSSVRKSIDEFFSIINDTNEDEVIKLDFQKKKFSFIVQRGTNGRRIMYSFLRTDGRTPYTERRHYKDDRQNKFGYFVQTVSKIRSSDTVSREEDLEKDYLVQRHNPNKDIVFHFSNLTPDYKKGDDPFGLEIDYREIGRKSIEYWNQAYKRAGAPNRVVLGEGDAPFGDIAYNTMNLVDSERGSNLLGVGPSLVDPYSGEVINANANVYIAPFREIMAGQIRNYIKAKTGLLSDAARQLPAGSKDNSTILGDMAESTLGIKDTLSAFVPEKIMTMVANFYHHGVANFTTDKINVDQFGNNSDAVADLYQLTKFNSENSMVQNLVKVAKRVPELIFLRDEGRITFNPRSRKDLLDLQQALEAHRPTFYRSYFMSDSAMASDYNTLTDDIEFHCAGSVVQLVNDLNQEKERNGGVPVELTTARELPALRHCMTQLIPDKFQATLIHEIGHTLGLRHNFRATADEDNFFTKSEVKDLYGIDIPARETAPRSTSVMDYVRTEQDRLVYPGHYDIAAIRYGYANSVEVKSAATRPNSKAGRYVHLNLADANDPAGSIIDELDGQGALVPFGFCTDIEASLEIDPLCARHDFGTNPQMIVNDSINSFWESFTLYNFRYDRRNAGVVGPFRRASRIDKLKRIYTEWRVHLANHLGKSDTTNAKIYLQNFSRPQYEALLTELNADPNFKGKDYLAVRDQIFDFIMDVAFFPNKYCLVNTGTSAGLKAYEFDKLRDELKNQLPKGTKISSCGDENMVKLIESKGYTYMYEAGLPVDNLWYAVNPQDTFEEDVNFRSFRAPIDAVGSFLDRYFASTFLGGRDAGYTGLLEKMFPNMMDEPDLFEKFEQRLVNRMIGGVSLRTKFIEVLQDKISDSETKDAEKPELEAKLQEIAQGLVNQNPDGSLSEVSLPNYSSESALLKALWLSLEQGMRNQFVDSSRKLSRYTRQITTEPTIIEDAQANGGFVMPLSDGSSLVVRREAQVAFALANTIVQISQFFQQANQQIPTVEQLTGSMNEPVLAWAGMVQRDAEGNLTAEQYYSFVQNLLGFYAQAHPMQQAIIEQVYYNDLLMYLVAIRPIEGADVQPLGANFVDQDLQTAISKIVTTQGPQEVAALLAQWNAKGMDVVAAEIQAQIGANYTVTVPNDETVINNFLTLAPPVAQAQVEAATQERDLYRGYLDVHGDELMAHFELLRSVLIYDFSQVNTDFQLRLIELIGDGDGEDLYTEMSKNSRADIRAFAKKHLNPIAASKGAKAYLEGRSFTK